MTEFDIIFAGPMKHLLYLDTTDKKSQLLILNEIKAISIRTNEIQMNHGQVINRQIKDMLEETGLSWGQIDGVCVLNGPGSYTGLRISLATAKGICYARTIPLILINKLDLMYHSAANIAREQALCPIIKARENEYFSVIYSAGGNQITEHSLSTKDELQTQMNLHQALLCFEELSYQTEFEHFIHLNISLNEILRLCIDYFREEKFADLYNSEPFYLKNVYVNKINKL